MSSDCEWILLSYAFNNLSRLQLQNEFGDTQSQLLSEPLVHGVLARSPSLSFVQMTKLSP